MHARYELARVANTLLLELIPQEPRINLVVLVGSLEARIGVLHAENAAFDFPYWARGTLAEVLHFLADSGLVELSGATGEELRSRDCWNRAHVRRTVEGDDFIRRARFALANLFEQLESIRYAEAASA